MLAVMFGCGNAQAQSLTEVVQNALANYPTLQAARAKTEAARSDIDRARAAHYPHQFALSLLQLVVQSTQHTLRAAAMVVLHKLHV